MSTYGASGAPSQNTINYDAILSTSLFNYQRTLTDNISKSNAFFYKIQENGMYEGRDGGVSISIPLMYALGTADWYEGYDTLSTDPTDGLTTAFFEWKQLAVPVSISRKEERQNSSSERIIDLLKAKIMQAELGLKEKFSIATLQGSLASGGTSLTTPDSSAVNGSTGIDPLPLLVKEDPTSSTTGGNINQSTSTWWRNQFKVTALTSSNKATDFLFEMDSVYNNCAKGPGGPPDFILTDQTTYQMVNAAYYQVYRRMADSDNNYPFENIRFRRALLTWDENVPDIQSATAATTTYGTMWFLNTKFISMIYDSMTNFISTPFRVPVNQDARLANILWMGNLCVSNRRKQGVWTKLPRTLAWTI